MRFMDRIYEKECKFKRYISEYYGQPLIVLGGGNSAKGIVRYLKSQGIKEFHVCVDKEYWKPGLMVENCKVESLDDLLNISNEKFDIIVAYFDYTVDLMDKYIKQFPDVVNTIIHEDVFQHFWMEPQIFCVDRSYYEKHNDSLTLLYESLADDCSKRALISFIEQRISGDYKYSNGILSDIKNEYCEPDLIQMNAKMTLIDCGAYDGNDTKKFFAKYGEELFSFLIEPDKKNIELINRNLRGMEKSIKIVNRAIWDEETTLSFSSEGGEGSGLNDSGDTVVESISIDRLYSLYPEQFQGKTTVIKMDIEGSELKALWGGNRFIRNEKPILVVCVYHKPEDIIEIPEFIKKANPAYKLYLRRYEKGFRDTVLYAIPE